jgi:hypothetical protein
MQTDLKNQLLAWASMHNLNFLIGFHNYVRGLFKDQLQDLEKFDDKDKESKLRKNVLYDYDRNLHVNTFLMMYSYFEEWLYLDWKAYAPNVTLDTQKKGSIGRFKDIVKQLGVDLSSKYWEVLMDAEEIRNCLLHANGRISLLKDPQKVRRIIDKKGSSLEIVSDRVVISGEYLQMLNENITNIMDTINNSQTQS